MHTVAPIPDEPAALVDIGIERALVVADYHAGFEAWLRYKHGIEIPSRAAERRTRIHALLTDTAPDRIVFLGDLMHSIGEPGGAERGELEVLFENLPRPVTVVKGNHDGSIESLLDTNSTAFDNVSITSTDGVRMGSVGFAHGHSWPSLDVLESSVVCIGHEHPCVRLTDEVGGHRIERVWLRGPLARGVFDTQYDTIDWQRPTLVVLPAFNDLCGGTWVNVPDQAFLSPFLPDGLEHGDAYLLDGTRLGPYREV